MLVKAKFLAVFSIVLLSSCGKPVDSNPNIPVTCENSLVLGHWQSSTDQLWFRADCTGTRNKCNETFTLPNVSDSNGSETLTVNFTGQFAECLVMGKNTCLYTVDSEHLWIDCGMGYTRFDKTM